MEQHCYPFENLPLPYDYNALEPNIDGKTMEIHHDVLLRGYVDRLNELLACQPKLQCMSLEQLLRGQLPAACPDRFRLRFEAGGVYNHRFFFRGMTPGGSNPSRRMEQILCRAFGGMEELRHRMVEMAACVGGSSYIWLVLCGDRLRLVTTAGQEAPISQGLSPVLGLDLWEHAYFLKHISDRRQYAEDWFDLIDWKRAESCYLSGFRGY